MKKIVFLLLTCFVFLSCEKEEEIPVDPSPANRTVLVYIIAENSLSSFAKKDIEEMMQGMEGVGERNNLIVYVDDYAAPRLIKIEKNNKGEVIRKTIKEYPEQSSIDPGIMLGIFEESFIRYPAKSYGLIFWSHGDDWLPYPDSGSSRSFGQDGGTGGAFMNISEMEGVLKHAVNLLEPVYKFDFIMFDACFMQSVEVAYQFRSYARYLIGSPIEIPGPGAPYQHLVKPVFATPLQPEAIAKAYYDYYITDSNYPMSGWEKADGAAISVIDMSALEPLAQATAPLLTKYADRLADVDVSQIQHFDWRSGKQAYYDLGDFMKYLVSDEEYQTWKEQLQKAVPYAAATNQCYSIYINRTFPMNSYSGISTYIPRPLANYSYWNQYYQTYDWYQAAGWNQTGW